MTTTIIIALLAPIVVVAGFQFIALNRWSPLAWPKTIRLITILLIDLADRRGMLPSGYGVMEVGELPPWVGRSLRKVFNVRGFVCAGLALMAAHWWTHKAPAVTLAKSEPVAPSYPYPNPLPTSGSTPPTVSPPIARSAYSDQPEMWSAFLGGGMRAVSTVDELNQIPAHRRKEGMLVWIAKDSKTYMLGRDLDTWSELDAPR